MPLELRAGDEAAVRAELERHGADSSLTEPSRNGLRLP